MSNSKTLSMNYAGGYYLKPAYSTLIVDSGVTIGGKGITSSYQYTTLSNAGGIQSAPGIAGITLYQGGVLVNTGAIQAGGGSAVDANGGDGVRLSLGGSINNAGVITGGAGFAVTGGTGGNGGGGLNLFAAVSVMNSGTITGGVGGESNVYAGGGADAVYMAGAGQITNTGSIVGGDGGSSEAAKGGNGVRISDGVVVNTSGLIEGGSGGASAMFGNTGGAGVVLQNGGTLTNAARIEGGSGGYGGVQGGFGGQGVNLSDGAVLNNSGTVVGGAAGGGPATRLAGYGVTVLDGARVINGAAGATGALISGYDGVHDFGGAAVTVTNYGTIAGTRHSIFFKQASDRLIVEAGSTFIGAIAGGGGTLELAAPNGTITGLGGAGTLSGGVAASFSGFGSYVIDGGAWTIGGGGTLKADQFLYFSGALTNAGELKAFGGADKAYAGLVAQGAATLSGGGTVLLDPTGILTGDVAGDSLDNVDNTITGDGFIEGPLNLTNGAAGVIDAADGRLVINMEGATLINAGLIEATAKGILLVNHTTIANSGQFLVDRTVQIEASTIDGGTVSVAAGEELTSEAGASVISGASVTNAGTLNGSAGGLTIEGDLTNDGLIQGDNGDLTITGAVSGTGSVRVFAAGTIEVDGALAQNVAFAAHDTGTLVLVDTAAFTGMITGFSKTGANHIDLKAVAYDAADTVAYSSKTKTLTLYDSAMDVLASLKLGGAYTGSAFILSQDASGGTIITDPPSPAAFASAMAGFGAGGASSATAPTSTSTSTSTSTLAHPIPATGN